MVEESQHQRVVAENPRTTRVRKIVLGAAASLLIDEGHHAVTAQQVSKVTGIARSTIYRHWPYQASLLLDAIDIVLAPHQSTPNTGELGADLTNALESLRLRLSRRPFRAMFAALLDHAARSSDLVPAQRRFVSRVTAPLRGIVIAAIGNGELAASIKPEEAVAQLAGPLFHQHVMLRARISDELIARTVEGFLAANQAPTAPHRLQRLQSSQ
jgi:AcrR family transcriptional regulator